jgi:hypothetical protein
MRILRTPYTIDTVLLLMAPIPKRSDAYTLRLTHG